MDAQAVNALDVCECGDYRRDHVNGDGPCKFNLPHGIGHGGPSNCEGFRMAEVMGMRLSDLDPQWIIDGGNRVGFVFRNPVRGHKGWWCTCFFAPCPSNERQEELAEAILGERAIYQCCNGGWTPSPDPASATWDTISVTPSLDGGPHLWHGHITNGEIVGGVTPEQWAEQMAARDRRISQSNGTKQVRDAQRTEEA